MLPLGALVQLSRVRTGGNTARVYHFDVPRLTLPACRANLFAEVRNSSIRGKTA